MYETRATLLRLENILSMARMALLFGEKNKKNKKKLKRIIRDTIRLCIKCIEWFRLNAKCEELLSFSALG